MSETTPQVRTDMLMLVRQQLELNLAQIADSASRHAAAPDNAKLTPCVALAHQISGALRMVQLPGAGRFGSEIETALKAALRGAPADTNEVAIAGRAASTLREFINDVASGGSYVPLRLFPAYRDLARVGGNATASEKDLFFPELHDNAPAHATPRAITPSVLPALVKDLRSRYQRGLLAWLKESTKPDGPAQMRTVLDQLHQIAAQMPEPRGLWWASTILMDSVVELLPDARAAEWLARVKPVCSRIDFLLRDLAAAAKVDTAPAQRDVYYAIASCPVPPPGLREARHLLQLDNLIPETPVAQGETQSQQPLLDDARTRIENLKDVWTEYIAGEPKRLGRFRDMLAPLTQKARELGNLPLLHLMLAISNATGQLPDPYPLDGQVMSLEMASALLMAESIVTHYNELPADLEQQIEIMKGWLASAVAGNVATQSPAGLRAEIVQKANDEKLRISTAREILKNLQQVEKAVETFALNPAKPEALAPLTPTLRQVHGVFEVSNQKRAARLALACQHLVERCAKAPPGQSQRDIEWLAEGLGCLGFYLEPCLHGREPAERAINLYFTRYEKQEGLEALLALSQQIVLPKPAEPAPLPAAVPAPPGGDREMLEVFLEEANEVLTAMESNIAQLRIGDGDHDALINVRRAFHTLKGSSRMVGLAAYGECAWEMEQLLNHWLAQSLPVSIQLLNLADDARSLLAEWAHALQGEAAPAIDTSDITARSRALRGVTPPLTVAAEAAGSAAAQPQQPAAAQPAPHPVTTAETLVRIPAAGRTHTDLGNMETMVISPTGRMRTGSMPGLNELAAATPINAISAPPVSTDTVRLVTTPRVSAPPPVPSHEPILADLGDRLLWIGSLIVEIQEQTRDAANPRLAEIASTLAESMGEARDLHRRLRELLATRKP